MGAVVTRQGGTAFSEDQYEEAYPLGVEAHFWHVARNATIADQVERAGMSRGPLLEIGCGRGIIVDHLRRRGIDCVGCDLARPPVASHLAAYVFPGCDFRLLSPERRASITGVLLCDVLEHLPVQGELLGALSAYFPSLRRILVTVPARSELWSEWDAHYGHFRRYDTRMLAEEIRGAGLELVTARYFFQALYPPMLLARRRRSTRSAAPRALSFHRFLGKALFLEGRVVPRWVPGASLLAVARVPGSSSDA